MRTELSSYYEKVLGLESPCGSMEPYSGECVLFT